MIKIGQFAIIDTGYIKTDASGTQASEITNDGVPIILKTASIDYGAKGNTDSTEIINSNDAPVVGFSTISAGNIVITGIIENNDDVEMANIPLMNNLKKTYGIKLLYYNSVNDGYRDITDSLGDINKDDIHKTNDFNSVSTPHLHIRVLDFRIKQATTNILRFTMVCKETE